MIENLPSIIPFSTVNIHPVLAAAPFILVAFLASPYFSFKSIGKNERSSRNNRRRAPL
jgi:hypothetical protein